MLCIWLVLLWKYVSVCFSHYVFR